MVISLIEDDIEFPKIKMKIVKNQKLKSKAGGTESKWDDAPSFFVYML